MFVQDAEVVTRKGDLLVLRIRKPGACCACSLLCSFPHRDYTVTLNNVSGTYQAGQIVKLQMSTAGTAIISFCLFVIPAIVMLGVLVLCYSVLSWTAPLSFLAACGAAFITMALSRAFLVRVPAWYSVKVVENDETAD